VNQAQWRLVLVTGATGAAADATLAWRLGWSAALPAYLFFGAIASIVSAADVVTRHVPNRVLLPAYCIGPGLLVFASASSARWWPLARAGLAMALLAGVYLALGMMFPSGMGLGDVKWAGVVGLYLGWAGWAAIWDGTLLAFLAAGTFVVGRRTSSPRGRLDRLPFAPFMASGALAAVLIAW
jgi:leader peptidase (prepilin peptidase)/N-methyltransferase